MSEVPKLRPKILKTVSSFAEQIADNTIFNALAKGKYKDMHAAEPGPDSECIDGKSFVECEVVKRVLDATVQRVHVDENDSHTGWVGYEPANTECSECKFVCAGRVWLQDGQPAEKYRFLFYKNPEFEAEFRTNGPYYNS